MSGKVAAAGQEIPLNGEGVFDLKGKRGRLTVTTNVPGKGDVRVEEILDGLVIYMRSDALAGALPSGKTWLKLDLQAAGRQSGVDIGALQQLGGGGDPTQFLSYLAKAGDVHKVGSEDVNGTSTTHYRATIDFAKLAGSAGAAASSVRQLQTLTGQKSLPTDIWIDAQHRVRRQTIAIATSSARCRSRSTSRSTTSASASPSTCARPPPPRRPTRPASAAAEREQGLPHPPAAPRAGRDDPHARADVLDVLVELVVRAEPALDRARRPPGRAGRRGRRGRRRARRAGRRARR